MKYSVEMGSDTVVYQFLFGSAVQKLIERGDNTDIMVIS
jgi:hypothetical protein